MNTFLSNFAGVVKQDYGIDRATYLPKYFADVITTFSDSTQPTAADKPKTALMKLDIPYWRKDVVKTNASRFLARVPVTAFGCYSSPEQEKIASRSAIFTVNGSSVLYIMKLGMRPSASELGWEIFSIKLNEVEAGDVHEVMNNYKPSERDECKFYKERQKHPLFKQYASAVGG